MTATYDVADPADFVAVEPSDRPMYHDVVVYTPDGDATIVASLKIDEAEAMVEKIRTTLATWPGFGG